jgi:predicted glycosyltransferase
MRVWYDACTGKHVRYGVSIAKRLKDVGHEVVLTTREHPDTLPMLRYLNEEFITVGRYNPESLLTRFKEGVKRQLLFCQLFQKSACTPDIAISHCSVDQCRVAFGLGIPIIVTIDTPYADAVNRLTLPIADYIVASKAIPKEVLDNNNVKAKIMQFDGADEVAWIKGFKSREKYDFGKPLIVVRQVEEKAAYTSAKVNMLALAKRLTRLGTVVFLSRYNRERIKDLIVPKGFVDSASLVAEADLFVGVGGTITREAALQGTPAIIIKLYPEQHVNDFLAEKGFPIFKTDVSEAPKLVQRLLGEKRNVQKLLDKLENPVDMIEKIVEDHVHEN